MSTDNTLYDIFTLHHVISKAFFKNFEAQCALKDLNFTHVRTMITLKFEGPCAMSSVSEKLGIEKGSFSSVAHYLIDKGYIEKKQDVNDKRVYYLKLLPKGKAFAEQILQEHLLFIEKEVGNFSELEKNIYFNAIKLIISMTEKISPKE